MGGRAQRLFARAVAVEGDGLAVDRVIRPPMNSTRACGW